jgi:hypothetical protein
VMFACSVAAAHAAQQVAASYSLGTWSTAALSKSRSYLAATSLPNLGVSIFAGGEGGGACRIDDLLIFAALRVVCFVKGMLDFGGGGGRGGLCV